MTTFPGIVSGMHYGSYWSRRHIEYKDHPFFRPDPTFEEGISTLCEVPVEERQSERLPMGSC